MQCHTHTKGKFVNLGDVTLRSGGVIQQLKEDECYKYLGIEELVGIKHEQMKASYCGKICCKYMCNSDTQENACKGVGFCSS